MTVHLVGAGPGVADLLTLRAARLLAVCDVVVHDRLIDPSVLALVPESTERIDVGKVAGGSRSQAMINELLVTLGRTHACVVRLKGGDPFVFGRGGEEQEALRRGGIDVHIVPGVSSAFAAPAAVGIPVTQRDVAAAVTVITGHGADDREPLFDWDALVRSGATLVVLMGVEQRARIAQRLIAAGMAPDTAVVAVERAWTDAQQAYGSSLAEIGQLLVQSPAVIVIGAVAALGDPTLIARLVASAAKPED